MMRLYYYSSERMTLTEAKWIRSKLALRAILIGCIIFFGFVKLNQYAGVTAGAHFAKTLESENEVLRQELSVMSPRIEKLDRLTRQLNDHANKLSVLLSRPGFVVDTVSLSLYQAKRAAANSLTPELTSFRP